MITPTASGTQSDLEETVRKAIGVTGVLFLMAAATAVFALPAGAAGYPPLSCTIQVASGTTATAGGSLGITGSGFAANSVVKLAVNGEAVGQTTASGTGTINTTIVVPSGATSPITIGASGGCSVIVALSSAAAAAAKPLAFTGSNSEPLVIIGIVALALGTVLVVGARRRGATKAAASEAVSAAV